MTYENKTLTCRDCKKSFNFSASEQEFFAQKNLQHLPVRCSNCRTAQRMKKTGKDPALSTEVPCDDCGVITLVPFKPTGAKPVYCPSCLHKRK